VLKAARLVASGCGVGYAPFAPGTWGSLVGASVGVAILAVAPGWLIVAIALAIGAGLWAVAAAQAADDPGWVVIDEIAGQLVAMLPLSRPSFGGVAAAFLLFRLFDIAKPGPVGWFDRRHDALGVVGDDIAAGMLAAATIWVARLTADLAS